MKQLLDGNMTACIQVRSQGLSAWVTNPMLRVHFHARELSQLIGVVVLPRGICAVSHWEILSKTVLTEMHTSQSQQTATQYLACPLHRVGDGSPLVLPEVALAAATNRPQI